MSQEKYIGMDVHQATISAAVENAEGKLLSERICTARRGMVTAAGTSESGCSPARDPLPCRCAVAWRFFIARFLNSRTRPRP